jgi:Flp pilus assembly protein TadD/outer membrane protein OmpA-like peptidoglycan-associated protein
MRRTCVFNFLVMILAAAFLSSCGLGRMVKKYNEVKFTATPEVLESHGGKVTVGIKGEFPAKYFNKKAVMVFQPVITYANGTKELKPITLKGESVKGDGTIINKKEGGSFTYTDVFEFIPDMTASKLEINPVIYKAGGSEEVKTAMKKSEAKAHEKSIELGNRKIGDGVINTESKVYHDEDVVEANQKNVTSLMKGSAGDFYEKETIVSNDASIFFVVNMSDLNLGYKLNKNNDAKTKLDSLRSFMMRGWKNKSVDIDAWASPEGEETRNQGLSERRAKTGNDYIVDFMKSYKREKAKKMKMKEKDIVPPEMVYAQKPHGEDWDSFLRNLSASDIKDKNTMINVIKSQPDHEKKEQEIRNMILIYKEVEDQMLAPLRRAEISIKSYLPKKTDEQIARLSTTYPDSLDQKELLYSASLTKDINTQMKIFKSMTTIYPQDWKGYANVAYVDLVQGNLDEAATYLDKANTISPNNPIVLNNMGVLAAKNLDYKKANEYYKAAQDLGVNVDYNKAILAIPAGDYKGAASTMSNKKCNYNLALATLLSGDASGAGSKLECAPDNGEKFYLMAIVGARTKNQTMALENLKKAVKEKPSLKAVAKEDREFLKYFELPEFKSLVQ